MSRTRLLPATALAVALVLTGCGGDPEPQIADPTPSQNAPPEGAQNTEPTTAPSSGPRQQERDFVAQYIDLMGAALSTGDPSTFIDRSTENCINCEQFASNLRDAYTDGGRISGGSWQLSKISYFGDESGSSVWLTDVVSTEETWTDGDGVVVKTVPAGTNYLALDVIETADGLLVSDIVFRQP